MEKQKNEKSKIEENAFHFVCTIDEARDIVNAHDKFWVVNCDCRTKQGQCKRSRHDVCLEFYEETAAVGTGRRVITREEVEDIFKESIDKNLVPRPFRDMKTKARTEGICFCCDCCCDYFLKTTDEKCEPGVSIEYTNIDSCIHCGECVDICFFDARNLVDDELVIDSDKCYGCGVCVDVCPEESIEMVDG